MWASVGGAVIGVAGSALSSSKSASAASDAADKSTEAAKYSADLQKQMYDTTRADQAPYRSAGTASLNKLGTLLGLGSSIGTSAPTVEDRASIYNRLKGNYANSASNDEASALAQYHQIQDNGGDVGSYTYWRSLHPSTQGASYDPNALNSAVDAEYAKQQQAYNAYQAQQNAASSDPNYGSMLKNYGWKDFNTEYGSSVDPASLTKNFTAADLYDDPSYLFRQSEGEKGINRALASRGMYNSGGAMKELDKYNSDLASTEYGAAYNRDAQNKSRLSSLFTDAYNRYNTNNTNSFNKLSSLAGLGQTATNQLQSAGQNYATNVGNTAMTSAANSGNAILAGANAANSGYSGLSSSLGKLASSYNYNNGGSTGYGSGYDPTTGLGNTSVNWGY